MISALERLRALRAGRSLDLPDFVDLDSLPMEWRIEYEERAAILKFDGRLSRDEADKRAFSEIIVRMDNLK